MPQFGQQHKGGDMRTFKITYVLHIGEYPISRLIEANDVNEATKKLGRYWSIRSISIKCAGTTKAGRPCQRFTTNDYCPGHEETSHE